MVWAGWKLRLEYPVAGNALALLGVGTVIYNGRNWLKHNRGGTIPGGMADKKNPSDFDPEQLKAGQKVEMEHTTDPAAAVEIAMDHLMEDARYYDKLLTAGL
jgi:hypothetical protein